MEEENLDLDNTNDKDILGEGGALKEARSFAVEVIKTVIISLAIVLPIRYFLIQPFFVSGASMEPNFHNGEYLIVDEISYRFEPVGRGDVIVFKYPYNNKDYYIKRVIGLPGEKVEISNGKVTIFNNENLQGFVLNETKYLPAGLETGGDKSVTLGTEEYFVLGDNRSASSDSRVWGNLERQFIVGRTWVRAWPPDQFSVFGSVDYKNGN